MFVVNSLENSNFASDHVAQNCDWSEKMIKKKTCSIARRKMFHISHEDRFTKYLKKSKNEGTRY